jgi:hypothetical protein
VTKERELEAAGRVQAAELAERKRTLSRSRGDERSFKIENSVADADAVFLAHAILNVSHELDSLEPTVSVFHY